MTNSYRDRQTILNNSYLLQKIEQHFDFEEYFWFGRLTYNNDLVISKQQVSLLLDINETLLNECLAINNKELEANGYQLLEQKELQGFFGKCDREILHNIKRSYDLENEEGSITVLELFTFKAWLNTAMLLSKSERAKFVRSRILDIEIDVAAEKEGGRVRYINRRIQYEFFESSRTILTCSKEFKRATQEYIELDRSTLTSYGIRRVLSQYGRFAISYDGIYQLVFGNNHDSYKQAMLLHTDCKESDEDELKRESGFGNIIPGARLRNALYYEAYRTKIDIEKGVAKKLAFISTSKGRKLEIKELDEIVSDLEQDSEFIPLIQKARSKMAIVDSLNTNPESFQDVLKQRFAVHKQAINDNNLDNFIEAKTKNLQEKLSMPDTLAVFQRLGDRNYDKQ